MIDKNLVDLMVAARNGDIKSVKRLIKSDVDINASYCDWTALLTASSNNHSEIVRYLANNGANLDAVNKFGETALINASNNGNFEMVKALVESGANLECKDLLGYTALAIAKEKGHNEIVNFLIENGAMDIKTNKLSLLEAIDKADKCKENYKELKGE